MAGGRPPIRPYSEWAQALEEWSLRDDSTSLCHFCVEQDTYPDKIYEIRDASEEFSRVLKKAKARIAARLKDKVNQGKYNYGIAYRYLPVHDQFLHDHEEAVKDREAERRAAEKKDIDPIAALAMANVKESLNAYLRPSESHKQEEVKPQDHSLKQD